MNELMGMSIQMFFNIMVSIGFFVGIVLMVSHTAFKALDDLLKKEYGFKIKLIPKVEDKSVDVIDKFIVKNRIIAGLIISVVSFILLVIFK